MKFNRIKRRNKLTLDEAWDEVDSNTGKLVFLKDGFIAQYDTKSKTYYAPNSKKDLTCDKGMIIYDSLTPIFFTAPREITSNDIIPLLEYFYPRFYGGLISIVALLNRKPDLVPGVKKEAPELFKAVKQFMEDFKDNEARTGSRYSNLFRQIFSLDMWPVHDPERYTPVETMKANYLWYKSLGQYNVAAEYATKYVAVKAMEDSLSYESKQFRRGDQHE